MKTPHRIVGKKKNGRWIIVAAHKKITVQVSAEGTTAGFKRATEIARERLGQKLRERS